MNALIQFEIEIAPAGWHQTEADPTNHFKNDGHVYYNVACRKKKGQRRKNYAYG